MLYGSSVVFCSGLSGEASDVRSKMYDVRH